MKLAELASVSQDYGTTAPEPRFRWVHSSTNDSYELREVGQHHAFAIIFGHIFTSNIYRASIKAGYRYQLYVSSIPGVSGPVAYCRDLDTAKDLARELAAEAMATKNSVAWAAGRATRQAVREAEDAARQEAARQAAALQARKNHILRQALDQYVSNLEEAIETHGATGGSEEELDLAKKMLEEMNGQMAALAG